MFNRQMSTFVLPALPYAKNALQPHISEETINYHYGKHHQTYVTNLNKIAATNPDVANKTLDQLLLTAEGVVFNQAGQIWNHNFYWNSLAPSGGGAPTGDVAKAIDKSFGSFDKFKEAFSAVAAGHFGSGWAWLVQAKDGSLKIEQTHDAGNPLRAGTGKPLLTCDVWEHAYYIDYRNARGDYINSWWKLVNWDFANKNLAAK